MLPASWGWNRAQQTVQVEAQVEAQVGATYQGCAAAGYSGCCTEGDCKAVSGCYCDVTCYYFRTCCDDITMAGCYRKSTLVWGSCFVDMVMDGSIGSVLLDFTECPLDCFSVTVVFHVSVLPGRCAWNLGILHFSLGRIILYCLQSHAAVYT